MAVTDTSIVDETRDRYLTYALSVVSGRALPDVRDGLKPVQRRILYAMSNNLNLKPTTSHRKSAAVVGEVLARYHPHGDAACYEAMVRMAQDFSLRYPLVDGQGNFGSLDGDNAAAYRYTEARLTAIALEVIGEINEDTVPFRDNFDGTVQEPIVFPSRVPNLLINGASGIAVGMATSIPPHNLRDTIKALIELSEDPEISHVKLTTIIKGPDFPTGCSILNTKKELDEIYRTGRGSIRMRGEWLVEDQDRGKKAIIVNSIPYAVNKSQLVEKIANLIIDKKIPQLVDIRDESTDDIRIYLELASGADPEVAMAYLFKNTTLESNFVVNLTVLVPTSKDSSTRPELLSLKECLKQFLDFRQIVVRKKLEFERRNLLERIHLLEGFVKIFDALDEAIKIVRKSEGRSDAATKLVARFKLTEIQAFAVVDMRIYQLSKTNIDEIRGELKEKEKRVVEISKTLGSKKAILEIVKKELREIEEKFGDRRKCALIKENIDIEFNQEDYVVEEDVFAIVTADGWIKRIRQANELGSTRIREGDSILCAHPLSTRDSVVFITNLGSIYSLRVADFPSSSGYGDPIQKVLKFKDGERIIESFGIRSAQSSETEASKGYDHLITEGEERILLSRKGMGFGAKLDGLVGIKRSGKRIMNLRGDDELIVVAPFKKEFAIFTRDGSALAISSSEISKREGAAVGVVLMSIREDDSVVSGISLDKPLGLRLNLGSGRTKDIKSSDVVRGRRALKGNKVIARSEVHSVEVVK